MRLLSLTINDISDNTATNMLIRLVGRRNINRQMQDLGLERTHLSGDVRTNGWAIRETLRTSPADLVHLLSLMARGGIGGCGADTGRHCHGERMRQ